MIAGTIIVEDITLHFQFTYTDVNMGKQCIYTVCDSPSGEEETVTCCPDLFAECLQVALNWEGVYHGNREYEELVSIMPKSRTLRWIPQAFLV